MSFIATCTGGLWSVVVAVLLAVEEPCFMMVVGVTCRAIRGVPGACKYQTDINEQSLTRGRNSKKLNQLVNS